MLEHPRKFKNSPNLLLLFVKITKFFEFSKKITIKTTVFSNSGICGFRKLVIVDWEMIYFGKKNESFRTKKVAEKNRQPTENQFPHKKKTRLWFLQLWLNVERKIE